MRGRYGGLILFDPGGGGDSGRCQWVEVVILASMGLDSRESRILVAVSCTLFSWTDGLTVSGVSLSGSMPSADIQWSCAVAGVILC